MKVFVLIFLGVNFWMGAATQESVLEQAKKAFESGKYARSLELFSNVITASSDSRSRVTGYYYQGLIFFELGYFYSSYLSFKNVLSSPEDGSRELFEKGIKNAVMIADRLSIMDQLGAVLERLPSTLVSPSVASVNHYAIGYFHYAKQNLTDAMSRLKSVGPDSPFYGKALFLLGVIATKKKEHGEAVSVFRKSLETTRGKKELFQLQELARLNLARSTYTAGDLEKSVEYYSQFTSASPHWLTVLLEASWPLMRLNDTTVSLGNLHTVTSPFYRQSLVGEAFILRATILYNLCKYEEMRQTLALFFATYDPIARAMETEKSSLSGGDAFFRAYASRKLHPAFMAYLKSDEGMARDVKVIELLRVERRNLAKFSRVKIVENIKDQIMEAEKQFSNELGEAVESLHKRKLSELLEQREQANYLKVEIVTGEKELIESQKGLPPRRIVDVETTVAGGYEFWPFHGEYWEDEMGAYVYTTESACVY